MATELENTVRDALRERAAVVTQQDLRQPELRRPGANGPSHGRWLAVAASVLAVLAIAVTLGTLAFRQSSHDRTGQAASALSLAVGYQWRLTAVQTASGRTDVPASLHSTVTFTRDGTVLGDDSVNALGAQCRVTAHGYVPLHASSTLVGEARTDPVRTTVIDAIDGLFFTVTRSVSDTPPEFEVTVRVVGDTLTLNAKGATTTFTRAGRAPSDTPASPTPTRRSP